MMITNIHHFVTRSAINGDRHKLANLVHFGTHIHRHLDWRQPLDWIGRYPYLLAEQDHQVVAALACPPDPPNIAWIRLFASSQPDLYPETWDLLWEQAKGYLHSLTGPLKVAAIPLNKWFCDLLVASGFTSCINVVVLSWDCRDLPPENQIDIDIRPMLLDDLPKVEQIDAAAFGGVWQNSQSCLEIAFHQAAVATCAELDGQFVGYQISTATTMGGHLARLAVHPDAQGQGVGFALLRDLLSQFVRRGAHQVTVNTQHDNAISLALYHKAGFHRTGEEYPLYQFELE